jgi:hypothetical protein
VKVGDVDGELQKLLVWRRKMLRCGHLIVEPGLKEDCPLENICLANCRTCGVAETWR